MIDPGSGSRIGPLRRSILLLVFQRLHKLVLATALFSSVAGNELTVLHETKLINCARKGPPRYQLRFQFSAGRTCNNWL
jgi:hypothetical protein